MFNENQSTRSSQENNKQIGEMREKQENTKELSKDIVELNKELKTKKKFSLVELAAIASILITLGGIVKEKFPKVTGKENGKQEISTVNPDSNQDRPKIKVEPYSKKETPRNENPKSTEEELDDLIRESTNEFFESAEIRHSIKSPIDARLYEEFEGQDSEDKTFEEKKLAVASEIDRMLEEQLNKDEINDNAVHTLEDLKDELEKCETPEDIERFSSFKLKR